MNLVAYSTLIDAQAAVFSEQVQKSRLSTWLPQKNACQTKFDPQARAGKIEKAHALLQEMREAWGQSWGNACRLLQQN